jgi:DNA-binding MarR family transcriptional regulator
METTEFKNIIMDYTRKIAESMNCIFSPVCEIHGLTRMQARILMELNQCGSHTIGSLAGSICAAGTNISSMCKKLEGQGLVERVRNREDERVVRVVLTRLGKETVLEIDRLFSYRVSQHLINEPEEDFDDIILGLKKLDELLQKISNIEKK